MATGRWGQPVITLGELLDALKDLPRDLVVEADGCDCTGYACAHPTINEDGYLVIMRRENCDVCRASST